MSDLIKNIVIVGGGTAGWLTAGIIAAEFKHSPANAIQITLVESPDVSTIGVGEGTWPSMRATLQKIGIAEEQLLRECSASFKQGSKFVGWRNGSEHDVYQHPFTIPSGFAECNLFAAWQTHFAQMTFSDVATIQNFVAENGRAPKQFATPEYAGVINYAYHLDAGKFGQLLQRHCTEKLQVKHILDHVDGVISAENGDIAALVARNAGNISGDLFIDCTGTHCLLLGGHYGIPFIEQKKFSNNDRAIATQVPYQSDADVIAASTVATAQSAGWTWDIGLSSRRGVGYVYSSSHISEEQAERELRAYIAKSIGAETAEQLSTKMLTIEAGFRQKFWHRNCVAVGMSAGFIEPLEASALALVELAASKIRDEMPLSKTSMSVVAQRFNEMFNYRWQRIIEFLKLHYVLTQRNDTQYWRDAKHPDTIPDSLRGLLSLWQNRPPRRSDFIHHEEIFPTASFQYVLYGMGFFPRQNPLVNESDRIDVAVNHIKSNLEKSRKYVAVLPSNREYINHVMKQGMPIA